MERRAQQKYSSNRLRWLYRVPWAVWILVQASAEAIVLSSRRNRSSHVGPLWQQKLARRLLRLFGVQANVIGDIPQAGELVSNHITYLDILVTASAVPCRFVSKQEVARIPLIGWFATLCGTIYIDRSRSAGEAISGVDHALREGSVVAFYPEGTTSTGDRLRLFRAALFAPAVRRHSVVTPAAMRYELPGGSVEREVAFVDEMELLPHILHLLTLKGIRAALTLATPFPAVPASERNATRKTANAAQAIVAQMLGVTPETEPGPLPE